MRWEEYLHQDLRLCTKRNPRDLLTCCRLFAVRFDTYLNAACRREVYPRERLQYHLDYPVHFDHWEQTSTGDYFAPETVRYVERLSTGLVTLSKKECKYQEYHKYLLLISLKISYIYRIFTANYWTLSEEMKVYRCLTIQRGKQPVYSFSGFTSSSFRIMSAFQFIKTGLDLRVHDVYLLEVTLSVGTNYVPVGLYSIQEEYEIVILTQGDLKVDSIAFSRMKWWNWFTDTRGREGYDKEIDYFHVKARLKPSSPIPKIHPFVVEGEK